MVSWSTHAGARTRRVGAALLVAAIAALLAACGSGTQDKSDSGSSNAAGRSEGHPHADLDHRRQVGVGAADRGRTRRSRQT